MQSRIAQYKAHQDWHEKYRKNCLERLKENRSRAVAERRLSNLQRATDEDGVKSEIDYVLNEEWSKLFGTRSTTNGSSSRGPNGAAFLQPELQDNCEDDFEATFEFLECIRSELLLEAHRYQNGQVLQGNTEPNITDLDSEETRMSCDNDSRTLSMNCASTNFNGEQIRMARTYEAYSTLMCPICESQSLTFDSQHAQVTCCTCSYLLHVSPHLCNAESLRRIFDEAIASHARAGLNRSVADTCAQSQSEQAEEDIEELLQSCVARPSFSVVSDGNTHNVLLSCDACDFMFLVV